MINGRLDKQVLIPGLLGTLIIFIAVLVTSNRFLWLSDLEQRLEWLVYDQRMRMMLDDKPEPDPRILIVDIDEKSLRKLGHWPWPRRVLGELVDDLTNKNVAAIGLDIVFAEPQRTLLNELETARGFSMSDKLRQELLQFNRQVDNDQRFAAAMSRGPVVLGYTFIGSNDTPVGVLPEPVYPIATVAPEDLFVREFPGYVSNIAVLHKAAKHAGFFTVIPDDDGVIRRAPMLVRHGQDIYESLALAILRKVLGAEDVELYTGEVDGLHVVEAISLGEGITIPTGNMGSAIIPYRGRAGSFRYLSALDVIEGKVPREVLENTIVLIGTTAAGLFDLRVTPVQSVYPGVEIHANLIAGVLDARIPSEPPWALGYNLTVIIGLGLLAAWLFPLLGPVGLGIATLASVSAMVIATTWLWLEYGFLLATATPVMLVIALAILNFGYGFLIEGKGRRQLKAVFGQYVPPERVEEMSRNPDGAFGVEGESREMSVLFCDIRSFTSISEKLAADELKRLLNFFFTPMTKIIFEQRGTIDKYVGDMIMAFWGAPLIDKQHNLHAVEAALRMLETLATMQDELKHRGWPPVNIGIGINSGVMNVGDMGSEYRRSYTVIGDAVNLGSRLEGLTKYYGVQLIVNETTRAGLDHYLFRQLDRVRVKGKQEPVTIYEPVCRVDVASEELMREVDNYHQALEHYFAARWPEARQCFDSLTDSQPENILYRLYQKRINELEHSGIADSWDGVYTHSTK